jgi:hypothetical protein
MRTIPASNTGTGYYWKCGNRGCSPPRQKKAYGNDVIPHRYAAVGLPDTMNIIPHMGFGYGRYLEM